MRMRPCRLNSPIQRQARAHHARRSIGISRLASGLAFGALLMSIGCGTTRQHLLVETTPPGARVTVAGESGQVLVTGRSPIKTQIDYERVGRYAVVAEPTAAQADGFVETLRTLNQAEYAALQATDERNATRRLLLALDEKAYVQIDEDREVLAPDGRWVIVSVKKRSFKDIAESGGAVPSLVMDLGEDQGITGMDISPDGRRIVYSQANYTKDLNQIEEFTTLNGGGLILPSKGSNLRAITIGGGGRQHITTENFDDKFPTFTPDGEHLVFASNRRRPDLSDILRVRASGRSGISNIYVNHRNAMILKPSFAADGTMAVELCEVDNLGGQVAVGDHFIWTIGGTNEYPTQIVRGAQPKISPDGKHIAYIGTDGNLWVTDVNGSNQTQLTFGADAITERYYNQLSEDEQLGFQKLQDASITPIYPFALPTWSADGQYILYTSMEGNDSTGRPNEDIWIMDREGGNKQQLTTNGSTDKYPLMSPDMRSVYFMSNRGEQWALWRIAAPVELSAAASP